MVSIHGLERPVSKAHTVLEFCREWGSLGVGIPRMEGGRKSVASSVDRAVMLKEIKMHSDSKRRLPYLRGQRTKIVGGSGSGHNKSTHLEKVGDDWFQTSAAGGHLEHDIISSYLRTT